MWFGLSLSTVALAACSLEVPGTGQSVDSGVSSDDSGPTQIEVGAPLEDAGYEQVPSTDRDAALLFDASSALFDASSAASDASSSLSEAGSVGCAIEGHYAVEVVFDVSWVGTQFAGIVPVISPGQGKLSFIVVGDFRPGALNTEFMFRACQASVPAFISTLPQEHYVARFSNSVWDSPSMPTFRGEVMNCREPGCALRSTPIHALIGSALADPAASWPTSAGQAEWPDHDGDGQPGVTAFMLGPNAGGAVEYPPLDLLALRRVQKFDLGMRVNLTLDGKRDSCDAISGEVLDGAIDTRALDCVADSRPMRCTADELRFLDDNLPAWTVRQGTFRGTRVKDSADCETVRQLYGFGQPSSP